MKDRRPNSASRKRPRRRPNAAELLALMRKHLRYNPEEGAFYQRPTRPGIKNGARLGTPTQNRQAVFLGVRYQTAALVWLWETGELPGRPLRHKNGDALDDRFPNLEKAPEAQPAVRRATISKEVRECEVCRSKFEVLRTSGQRRCGDSICRATRHTFSLRGARVTRKELADLAGVSMAGIYQRLKRLGIRPGEEVPPSVLRPRGRPRRDA